jgi:hypothetical protein
MMCQTGVIECLCSTDRGSASSVSSQRLGGGKDVVISAQLRSAGAQQATTRPPRIYSHLHRGVVDMARAATCVHARRPWVCAYGQIRANAWGTDPPPDLMCACGPQARGIFFEGPPLLLIRPVLDSDCSSSVAPIPSSKNESEWLGLS